jgi:hypothetical protein
MSEQAEIEAVARAIFAADMPPGTNPDAQYPKGFDSPYEKVSAWSVYEKAAIFAILAYEGSLAKRGLAVVPVEATAEIIDAGRTASERDPILGWAGLYAAMVLAGRIDAASGPV